MKQTEVEFFFARSKKNLISNFVKFLIFLVIACFFAVVSSNYWGTPIIALTLIPVVYSSFWIFILMFRIYKNVKDYRTLSDLCNYANSLDIQSMENKED
jgi:multisubunit Na+/H+ antiporter MnhB subunit